MILQVLGSASAQGIPQPLCRCFLCQKAKGKNRRLRSSYLIHLASGKNILLDSSPDFPQQYVNSRFDFDYLFLSHKHRDHTQGLEEIRMDLEAHDKQRRKNQKQRVFLLGKTLNRWLSDGKRDARWEESTQQAYQQLISKGFFRRQTLTPFKKSYLERGGEIIYIRGKHGQNYCGGLVIKDKEKTLVYLADISEFNNKLSLFLSKINADLLIIHLPFFFNPKDHREKKRHPGVEQAKNLPGKRILISHFSHRAKLTHHQLIQEAKRIDKRIIVAFDGQRIKV